MTLHRKIFLGLIGGLALGAISRLPWAAPLQRVLAACEPLGTAFIRLVTMVVVPLVVASLFVGVASLGDVRRLGRIGGRTLVYFLATTVVAATIGLIIALTLQLGTGVTPDAGPDASLPAAPAAVTPGLAQTLVQMVPQNPIASAAQSDLLPLIIAVCIFGAAATVTRGENRRTVVAFFEGINELSTVVIGWLMLLAPAAVFVLMASLVARSGAALLQGLLLYVVAVVAALALHLALLLLLLRTAARMGVVAFFTAVSDALLLAFSTASSSVALPVSMAAARTGLGLPNDVVSFVLPSGTTLNKNGAAIYKSVTAVFLAHLLRRAARTGTARDDRADLDAGGARGGRRCRQLAGDDADRAERHRPRPARRRRHRAGHRHRSPARHVPHAGQHRRQPRRRVLYRRHG